MIASIGLNPQTELAKNPEAAFLRGGEGPMATGDAFGAPKVVERSGRKGGKNLEFEGAIESWAQAMAAALPTPAATLGEAKGVQTAGLGLGVKPKGSEGSGTGEAPGVALEGQSGFAPTDPTRLVQDSSQPFVKKGSELANAGSAAVDSLLPRSGQPEPLNGQAPAVSQREKGGASPTKTLGLTDPRLAFGGAEPAEIQVRANTDLGHSLAANGFSGGKWVTGRTALFSDPRTGGEPVRPLFGGESQTEGTANTGAGSLQPELMEALESLGGTENKLGDFENQSSVWNQASAGRQIPTHGVAIAQTAVAALYGNPMSGAQFLQLRGDAKGIEGAGDGVVMPRGPVQPGEPRKLMSPLEEKENLGAGIPLEEARLPTQPEAPKELKVDLKQVSQKGTGVVQGRVKRDRGEDASSLASQNFGSSMPLVGQAAGRGSDGLFAIKSPELNATVVSGAGAKEQLSNDALTGIAGNIRQFSVQSNGLGGGEMRIRLRPEALGELTLRVQTRGQEVGLQIQASSESARKILEDSLEHLKEKLQSHHLSLGSVEISAFGTSQVASSQGGAQAELGRQNQSQNDWQQHQNTNFAGQGGGFGQSQSNFSGGQSSRHDSTAQVETPGLGAPRLSGAAVATRTYGSNQTGTGRIDVKA